MKNKPTDEEVTRFFAAIDEKDSWLVKEMLSAGLPAGVKLKQSYALLEAVFAGESHTVEVLLDAGADVNRGTTSTASDSFVTPLNAACSRAQRTIVGLLLERGADPRIKSVAGDTPAHLLLRDYRTKKTALSATFVQRTLSSMLDKGLSVNEVDRFNRTLLHCALTSGGEPAIVKLLLDRGAAVRAKTTAGDEPIHCAALNNRVDVLPMLLAAGASADAIDSYGKAPLAMCRNEEMVHSLLDAGANVDRQDEDGYTALHNHLQAAVPNDADKCVLRLLAAGANPHLQTNGGLLPLDIVKARGLTWCEAPLSAASARAVMKHTSKRVHSVTP